MIDPVRQESGRRGGLATARKRQAHLSEPERKVLYELEQQARSYRDGTNGGPFAVAAWLGALADQLRESGRPEGEQ